MTYEDASLAPLIERYLDVILRIGINIQPGQTLVVGSDVSGASVPFARQLAERAYALGAGDVVAQWNDAAFTRLRVLHGNDAALNAAPTWRAREQDELVERGAAFLNIFSPDPEALAGVDPQRLATMEHVRSKAFANHIRSTMSGEHVWCVAAIPGAAWARQVFPGKGEADAIAELWRYVLHVTRADTPDPIAAWGQHQADLAARRDYLSTMRFARLRYRAPGTDLTIELPEGHRWIGGGESTPQGYSHIANIPTEEVFSLPKRDGVSGTVRSTLPLHARGEIIEHLTLTFERGRIVEYGAERGAETLKHIIETDDGSHALGEVALVPITSPCNTGFPLYNTLFDENASCHLAIGRAYPICLEASAGQSEEELAARGVNFSAVHVDFMIGSDALDIDGETASGMVVPLFRAGDWAPNVPTAG